MIGLAPDGSAAADLELEQLGQRVHDRDADAVQTTGNLVAVLVELPARVQRGHHDFGRRALFRRVLVDGNAATIVVDRHAVVGVDDDVDLAAVAGERFVDRVVDDFVDEVMEAFGARRPDVHRRPFANRVEAFEDLDGTRVVRHEAPSLQPGPTACIRCTARTVFGGGHCATVG